MSVRSVTWRSWRSFLGGREPHFRRVVERRRDGYTLWQRFWASFIGVELPPGRFGVVRTPRTSTVAASPSAQDSSRHRPRTSRLAPGWFRLPPLPDISGLAAAGDDAVVLEASCPDGAARFLVRADWADQPEYTLELVLQGVDAARPLVCPVQYISANGGEQVLLVPVVQGQFGPPASLIRLPGFTADSAAGWSTAAPSPVTSTTAWDAETVATSVHAALNEATRDAWRRVQELAGDDLNRVIGGALP
jgi:hypothetical protein